ncbi:hypothetical protein BXT89_15195 [Halopseudomonas pachastrellae]|jgi:uncharacterized protein (DUF488 family)|uniref:DUF488 domain-containing protein n=1 Tax=Halopseudomonas pachastrellae TaxID=254161 RepID=A0A1S8DEM9_9GAMM|nr:DUF488 domain-containing protein [Halopseudomonas pachastrellae]ONM43000.1 hypothetical protein BXT89_15195 [Halopseudomonas pachastrellae]SFM93659.1 Protein of unknown function, DUF488 [Halopseudomonas pachastrellae]
MKIFTIGFTRKSAEQFFSLLGEGRVKTLIDVRLNNHSQLAGFAKRDDLAFFLREFCQAEYMEMPEMAPTKPLLGAYRNKDISWGEYEARFLDLMATRRIEHLIRPAQLADGCLLCSEHLPHQCHRRLVVEYLSMCWDEPVSVEHLY